jgi:hypothetical protein
MRAASPPDVSAVDAAFDDGLILRTHVLRPTWHYVAATDLRWLMAFSGPRVDAANARKYRDLELDELTLSRSAEVIASAVSGGPQTRQEIASALTATGISTGGERLVYMLMHSELTSTICSGPKRGNQHTYAAFDSRTPPSSVQSEDEAAAALAWRYFRTRGPATLNDFAWWSGLPVTAARRGLGAIEDRLDTIELEGRRFWFAEGQPQRIERPVINLVARFDEIIISYRQSRDILNTPFAGIEPPAIDDGLSHVILLDGQLLGRWRSRADRQVDVQLARRLDHSEHQQLKTAIQLLQASGT